MTYYFIDTKHKKYGPFKDIFEALKSYVQEKCGKATLYEEINRCLKRIDSLDNPED